MRDPDQIRERFQQHLGDQYYARFVRHFPASDEETRLSDWMEHYWQQFELENPDYKLDLSQIAEVFGNCPVYGAKADHANRHRLVESWLTDAVPLKELETKHAVADDRLGAKPVAFGFQSEQWLKLKAQFQDGDEFREFMSPPKSWEKLAGRFGVALVRDGRVIDLLVTLRN